MKTKLFIAAFCCMVMSLLASCDKAKGKTADEPAIDKEQIKAEIVALETAYADGINIGNANAASVYFADDAQSFHHGETLRGKAAIMESIKNDIANVPDGSKVSFITNDLLISSDGGQVVETGTYAVSNSSNPAAISGNFISVFEKRNGKYVCVREIGVTDQPKQ
ncbi:MAG TPA: nuclear transport factor 2 family protein [Flavobacterium sp.]|jgi:ketosteroid isomerase-like protein